MEVIGNLKTTIDIDPIDVIDKLRIKAVGGYYAWIEESNGRYFKKYEKYRMEHCEEISKEKYLYIKNLIDIIDYLKNEL